MSTDTMPEMLTTEEFANALEKEKVGKQLIDPTDMVKSVGILKFKDKAGRNMYEISNRAEGSLMVVRQILFKKVPNSSNKIEVILVMPNPEKVDVVQKKNDSMTDALIADSRSANGKVGNENENI